MSWWRFIARRLLRHIGQALTVRNFLWGVRLQFVCYIGNMAICTEWAAERYWIRPSKALLTVAWSHPYPEGTVSAMVSSVIERHDVTDGTCPAAEVPLRYGLTTIDENDTQRNRKKVPKVFSVRWKSCIFAYDRLRLTLLSIGCILLHRVCICR